jgi:hypothetical protein
MTQVIDHPWDRHPFSDLPLLLVSGAGRSGTTALRQCVAAHPDIDCLNRESNYIFDLMRNAHLSLDNPFRVKNLVVSAKRFWQCHQQLILHLHWPVRSIADRRAKLALATYSMLDPRAAIGLAEAFPTLSHCHIVRNGIEVVSSYVSFPNFSHLSFEDCCRIWARQQAMIQYVTTHKHATLVRYEWLREDRDAFSRALDEALRRCGLAWHPQCRKPLSRTWHPTRFSGESRADARKLSRRKDRWKYWSPGQRDRFTEICGETMQMLGYDIPWLEGSTPGDDGA